ncbi:MAG: hypothetical protein AW07_04199 [Candidatus Accumulibacter sp. SK-11]|nr:MAG: hypothetical protein AW07_04199 [Candidatus Accumulibacter sp. SK-11]
MTRSGKRTIFNPVTQDNPEGSEVSLPSMPRSMLGFRSGEQERLRILPLSPPAASFSCLLGESNCRSVRQASEPQRGRQSPLLIGPA